MEDKNNTNITINSEENLNNIDLEINTESDKREIELVDYSNNINGEPAFQTVIKIFIQKFLDLFNFRTK